MYSKFFFIILLLFFGLLGFAYSYHLPIAKTWLKSQIVAQTQGQSLQFIPSDLEITFFPMGFHLNDIEIKPHKKFKSLSPFTIERLSFIINFSSIFSGYFLLNELRIKSMNIALDLDKSSSTSSHPKKTNAFLKKWSKDKVLPYLDLPIASVVLEDTQLSLSHSKGTFNWNDLSFKANRKREKWSVAINSSDLIYQNKASSQLESHWTFKTRFNFEKDRLFVSNLSFGQGSNYFILSGYCSIEKDFKDCLEKYKIQVRSYFSMQTAQNVALFFYPDNPQQLSGTLEVSATLENSQKRSLHAVFKTYFKELKIDRFYIGQAHLEGSFQNNVFYIPKVNIQNHGNFVDLNETRLLMDENFSLKTQIQIRSLEIRQLLADFQVGPPPLHLDVEGEIPCEGQFLPEVRINCTSGHLAIGDFVVYQDDQQKNVIALNKAEVRGHVQITKNQVMVNSKLKIGKTQGQVSGYVNYKSGFYFDFATSEFHFSDLTSLVNLKFEGKTALKGFTRGDSKQAIVLMDLQTKDLWFEDYGIGDLVTALKYRSGILSFQNIQGIFGQTEYTGNLEVYLKSSALEAKIKSQTLQLTDLREIFKRKYPLPFDVYAFGKADVHIWGPLKFNQLSYDIDVDIGKGIIGSESFDKILFHVNARNGEFKTEKVEFHKGPSRAIVSSGVAYPNGQIDIQLKGSDFYLEQSQTLKDLKFNVFGQNNFDLSLKGHVLKPEIQVSGQIEGFHISEIPISTPYYQIKVTSNGVYLEGFLENKSLNLKTLIPLHQQSPFSIEFEANRWDFTPIFALFTQEDLVQEYEAFVSGKFNISSSSDWIWKANGFAQFDQIVMRRGKNYLYLKQPTQISFKNGKMNMKDFTLTGNNTQFTVEAKDSQKDNLQMSLHGKIDTYMIAFLTPFLEDLRGLLELNCDIGGSTQALQLMGSAYMRDGYAKLNGLLHPFEDLRMEVLFSEENIILTDFYTHLTTGTVTADGRVAIQGWRNFPTQIMAKAKNISLEIPEDVQTRGDAQIQITGSWFPFLFKGNYDVKKARVTMEFNEATESASVRYTSLLPESLIKTNRSVIEWDVVTSFQSDAFISNSLIDSHFYGDLRLLGVLDRPVFLGEIHFAKNGIFKFRDTPFKITTASIQFPSQEEFDPIVSLIASTQVKEYDINLLIQGTQSDHTIQFESNPSLPEDGIISLIALGFVARREDDTFSSQEGRLGNQALNYAGNLTGRITGLEKVLKDTTGVEVNVSSTADSEDFEDVPRVTLKKQWGPQLSTSLSRRLGSGLNADITDTDPVREFPKSDVKIEYQLDEHFSIVGMWEDRETHFLDTSGNTGDTSNTENKNILGLDLKYELEFLISLVT